MQPEDMHDSTGKQAINAEQQRILDLRAGRRVEAVVVRPINPGQPAYSASLTALTYEGCWRK